MQIPIDLYSKHKKAGTCLVGLDTKGQLCILQKVFNPWTGEPENTEAAAISLESVDNDIKRFSDLVETLKVIREDILKVKNDKG